MSGYKAHISKPIRLLFLFVPSQFYVLLNILLNNRNEVINTKCINKVCIEEYCASNAIHIFSFQILGALSKDILIIQIFGNTTITRVF